VNKAIFWLIKKEFLLEWRERYAINGILLYLLSTIFIIYLTFRLRAGAIGNFTWNAIFWIILLFTAVNAVAKSFIRENQKRHLYFYVLTSPESLILSKIIYNALLMFFLGIVGFFCYSVVMGNPVEDHLFFIINLILAGIGFSSILTMISSIAAQTEQSSTLMTILSLPVLVPILLMAIKISQNALDGLDRTQSYDELLTLLAINIIVATISYILFPYLWRS